MSAAPLFPLTHDQALRLQSYIQNYRHYAFTSLLPSAERNTTLRVLQVLQGKLIEILDQASPSTPLSLLLTSEEMTTFKAAVTELLSLYTKQPESAARIAVLGDLAALKICLKRY